MLRGILPGSLHVISSGLSQYLFIFVAGVAGSFHCIGMCGGFACALGSITRQQSRFTAFERHLLYNSGRLTTYVFLGVIAGVLGHSLAGDIASNGMSNGQRMLAISAGILMLVMSFQFFGWWKKIPVVNSFGAGAAVLVPLRSLLASPSRLSPLAFGIFNGFLPCPLVYAFVAKAVASGETLSGVFTMLSFGLGTFPAMLLIGGLGYRLSVQRRKYGVWLAGGFIMFFGIITLIRGIIPMAGHGQHF